MSEENLDQNLDQSSNEEGGSEEKPKKGKKEVAKRAAPMKAFPRFERGSEEVEHHLFKLKVATLRKNVSWIYRSPTIAEIEHAHFYHSINDTTLQPNKFSTPVGGHFHEVIVEIDPVSKEILSAKCGPPVRYVNRKVAGGRTVRRLERVRWEKYNEAPLPQQDHNGEEFEYDDGPAGKEAEVITDYDNHTHELQYMGFETFTTQSKTEARKAETQKVRSLMSGPASTQPGAMDKLSGHTSEHDKVRQVMKESDGKSTGS